MEFKQTVVKEMPCKVMNERKMYSCGIDRGIKDYQVISYYDNNRNLIEEKIECLNNRQ